MTDETCDELLAENQRCEAHAYDSGFHEDCVHCLQSRVKDLVAEIKRLREENKVLARTTQTYYTSGEEVDRYCRLSLMERLKDRGGLMKCVPGAVVATINAAAVTIERLRKELDEVKSTAKQLYDAAGNRDMSYGEWLDFGKEHPWLEETDE